MTNKAKFTWFALFTFFVIMIALGILDALHHDYPSAMINIGVGLIFFSYLFDVIFFSYLFDVKFFMQPINLANLFTLKKVESFSIVTVIYYAGILLWVLGIIGLLL